MPGLTAYFCLLDVGAPKPGDTVLVTAASGAVGSVAGQIAKIKGCRAVAIAGSAAKIAYCTDELGYDAAIDYNAESDLSAAIARAAPRGVDVFFDNVGGGVHQAVIERLNVGARIALCGVMSQYNPTEKSRAAPYNLRNILIPRARMQGFLIYDYAAREREGLEALAAWYRAGRIKFRETIAEGLEAAPLAFRGLLRGENLGKQLVRVGPERR
jgi:NADPH-dependent curcumin reductase CurA